MYKRSLDIWTDIGAEWHLTILRIIYVSNAVGDRVKLVPGMSVCRYRRLLPTAITDERQNATVFRTTQHPSPKLKTKKTSTNIIHRRSRPPRYTSIDGGATTTRFFLHPPNTAKQEHKKKRRWTRRPYRTLIYQPREKRRAFSAHTQRLSTTRRQKTTCVHTLAGAAQQYN